MHEQVYKTILLCKIVLKIFLQLFFFSFCLCQLGEMTNKYQKASFKIYKSYKNLFYYYYLRCIFTFECGRVRDGEVSVQQAARAGHPRWNSARCPRSRCARAALESAAAEPRCDPRTWTTSACAHSGSSLSSFCNTPPASEPHTAAESNRPSGERITGKTGKSSWAARFSEVLREPAKIVEPFQRLLENH